MTTSRPFRYDAEMVIGRSLRRARRRLIVAGLIIELALFGVFVWITIGWGFEWPSIVMLLFTPVLYGVMYFLAKGRIRKSLADPRNRLSIDRSVQFDEALLTWSDVEGGRSQLPWSAVIGRERMETTTLIWITAQQALFIPDSAWLPGDLEVWNTRVERLKPFVP